MMTLEEVLQAHPNLKSDGFWNQIEDRDFDQARFDACVAWLKKLPKTKTLGVNTHALKVAFENQVGYVTNGEMQAAVIALGMPWKLEDRTMLTGVSKRVVDWRRSLRDPGYR